MTGFRDILDRSVTANDAYSHQVFGEELKVKEKDFQAQLMKVVDMLGGLVLHIHDSRREVRRNGERVLVGDAVAKGYPDLTIVTSSRHVIWAELKVGKKKPTETQWIWLRALPDHQAYLWRDTDWDDAVRIIQYGHRMFQSRPYECYANEPTCIACGNLDKKGGREHGTTQDERPGEESSGCCAAPSAQEGEDQRNLGRRIALHEGRGPQQHEGIRDHLRFP